MIRGVRSMRIYISAKQIRKRGHRVETYPYEVRSVPRTLRELIALLVTDGVERYNHRLRSKSDVPVLHSDEIDAMGLIGKIGFGLPFGTKEADLQEALDAALQGFEDGLYRFFVGEREVESLDADPCLREGDTITIIRLVMLTGSYF